MPIATPKLLICPKCGYETVRTIGDVITPTDFICSKCGGYMEMGKSKAIKDTLFNVLKGLFTKK